MKRKAKIIFLSREKGGRWTLPGSGYGPQIRIKNIYTSCIITPQDSEIDIMNFDTEYDVFIELRFEDIYGNMLDINSKIELYEGDRLIGVGNFDK